MTPEEVEKDIDEIKQLRDRVIKNQLLDDTVVLVNKEIRNRKRILVEDASSSSMDVDTGLYPFTDSFHTTTGAVCTGLGVPEDAIETVLGVFSAVSIISGSFLKRIREFPTRITSDDPAYDCIRDRFREEYDVLDDEYAFGWTDLNLIRHAENINKLSGMMVTHLDVLNDVDNIKLATKYTLKHGDETQIFDKSLPANIDEWEQMVPKFTEMPGWNQGLEDCSSFS